MEQIEVYKEMLRLFKRSERFLLGTSTYSVEVCDVTGKKKIYLGLCGLIRLVLRDIYKISDIRGRKPYMDKFLEDSQKVLYGYKGIEVRSRGFWFTGSSLHNYFHRHTHLVNLIKIHEKNN